MEISFNMQTGPQQQKVTSELKTHGCKSYTKAFITSNFYINSAEGDKEVATLIPAVYLLKTVYKKEKQSHHSHTNC